MHGSLLFISNGGPRGLTNKLRSWQTAWGGGGAPVLLLLNQSIAWLMTDEAADWLSSSLD